MSVEASWPARWSSPLIDRQTDASRDATVQKEEKVVEEEAAHMRAGLERALAAQVSQPADWGCLGMQRSVAVKVAGERHAALTEALLR